MHSVLLLIGKLCVCVHVCVCLCFCVSVCAFMCVSVCLWVCISLLSDPFVPYSASVWLLLQGLCADLVQPSESGWGPALPDAVWGLLGDDQAAEGTPVGHRLGRLGVQRRGQDPPHPPVWTPSSQHQVGAPQMTVRAAAHTADRQSDIRQHPVTGWVSVAPMCVSLPTPIFGRFKNTVEKGFALINCSVNLLVEKHKVIRYFIHLCIKYVG